MEHPGIGQWYLGLSTINTIITGFIFCSILGVDSIQIEIAIVKNSKARGKP
jgi:hypothetical protein